MIMIRGKTFRAYILHQMHFKWQTAQIQGQRFR